MLNETKHLKVNFGSLPVPANCQRSTWLNWLLESIKTDTATFAQVEDQTGNCRWQLLDSTLVYRCDSNLFGFKTGAVYEAETGLRTVSGHRLSAEAYLDHLDRVPVTDINQMPYVILASHLVSRLDSIHKTQDHEWDHSQSQIVSEGEKWRVNLKVPSRGRYRHRMGKHSCTPRPEMGAAESSARILLCRQPWLLGRVVSSQTSIDQG